MLMDTEVDTDRSSRSPSASERDVISSELITSFSNPNYNIEEDILNCNVTTPLLEYTNEEILNRLEGVVSLREGEPSSSSGAGLLAYYKELAEAVRLRELECLSTTTASRTEEKASEKAEVPPISGCSETKIAPNGSSPGESLDCGIQSETSAGKSTSAYDLSHVVRRREKKTPPDSSSRPSSDLPDGWEKYEDEEGPYYWHVRTGTIQRAPPTSEKPVRPVSFCSSDISSPSSSTPDLSHLASLAKLEEAFNFAGVQIEGGCHLSPIPSETSSLAPDGEGSESLAAASASSAASLAASARNLRFCVRSLGWAVMADDELTPERSSQSVNRCIVRMAAAGRREFNDSAGAWGEGQDLILELTNSNLVLLSSSEAVLHKQSIMGIKVWGVGRENNRDFAYVSRDRVSRKYHCHVFRCDQPARHLANTLCSLCKHLVMERKRRQSLKQQQHHLKQHQQLLGQQQHTPAQQPSQRRPMSLPGVCSVASAFDRHVEQSNGARSAERGLSFPTPMEEPKKLLRCLYIGCTPVKKPMVGGVEILNEAIEKMRYSQPRNAWLPVTVTVAPSTVKIVHEQTLEIVAECRVRFLVFMGISMSSVQLCGFIVHTAQNTFVCHVLNSEPTCGTLCKTIEAACTLRYQKCLDAHNRGQADNWDRSSEPATTPSKRSSIKEGLQSMWAAMSLRKPKP